MHGERENINIKPKRKTPSLPYQIEMPCFGYSSLEVYATWGFGNLQYNWLLSKKMIFKSIWKSRSGWNNPYVRWNAKMLIFNREQLEYIAWQLTVEALVWKGEKSKEEKKEVRNSGKYYIPIGN